MVKRNIMNTPSIVWTGGEYKTKCVVGMERDGVLNEWIGDCGKPEDFKAIPKSMLAVSAIRNKGYRIVIITDQSGINKGLFKQEDVDAVNDELMRHLGQAGCAEIEALYYSAGIDKKDPYVKPNIGMFKRCETEHKDVKFKGGYYVGHTIKDLKAAVSIGAKPVLVRTGKGAETEQELNRWAHKELKKRTIVFDNLDEFAKSLA